MQAKKIEGKLLCLMSEYEARVIREVLGCVGEDIPGPINSALNSIRSELVKNNIYFTGDVFNGELELTEDSADILEQGISVDGWESHE